MPIEHKEHDQIVYKVHQLNRGKKRDEKVTRIKDILVIVNAAFIPAIVNAAFSPFGLISLANYVAITSVTRTFASSHRSQSKGFQSAIDQTIIQDDWTNLETFKSLEFIEYSKMFSRPIWKTYTILEYSCT